MKISLIIPTYKRSENLKILLDNLNKMEIKPDEIIVVYNNNDIPTKNIMKSYKNIKKIEISMKGCINALNAGLKICKNEIVCFTDDDAIPSDDWVLKIKEHFQNSNIGALGGIDIQPGYKKTKNKYVGRITYYGRIIGNHHIGTEKIQIVDHLKGVNMCFKRNLIDYIDNNLIGLAPPFWELDICLRIKQKKYKIIYDPELIVFHYPSKTYDGRRGTPTFLDCYMYSFNYAYILYKYLKGFRKFIFLIYSFLIGDRTSPSFLRIIFRPSLIKFFNTAIIGKFNGIKQYIKLKKSLKFS